MPKFHGIIVSFFLVTLLMACATPAVIEQPAPLVMPDVQIARHPQPADYSWLNTYTEVPVYDPDSTDPWQVDLRSSNLTHLDLSNSGDDLIYADFDSKTKWPTVNKMPANFDWQTIMETGKNPGLGIKALHEQGITGRGIGLAIIDQTLLVDHIEYKDNIRVYEESDDIVGGWLETQMHGPAVASIAVGKSVGVAPDADLYYIATGDCGSTSGMEFSCKAKAVQQIIEINTTLPVDRKIRVLSMSIGWGPDDKGYDEIMAAVRDANAAGIFIISSSLGSTSKLYFHGLGRDPFQDPDRFESYTPGLWWEKDFFSREHLAGSPASYKPGEMLLVPMDSRTTASPTGTEDYAFYRAGGWSWSIPYLAGMYVLAVQVKPDITPNEFWETALNTGRTIHLKHNSEDHEFGIILDPQALIEELKTK